VRDPTTASTAGMSAKYFKGSPMKTRITSSTPVIQASTR
jgi:hypothetical protein